MDALPLDTVRDRAFADAMVRMAWARTRDPALRERLAEIERSADEVHAALRAEIRAGLRGAALRARFDAVAVEDRDHFVEEALGIAYLPLDEAHEATSDDMGFVPSGYAEIVHAFEAVKLNAGQSFLDIGSGTGKVVMLAALLTGARASGIEHARSLHGVATRAAAGLALDIQLTHGDVRESDLEPAEVVFMFLPFTGTALGGVMRKLAALPNRKYLCAGALDLDRYPELVPVATSSSWLNIYEWR